MARDQISRIERFLFRALWLILKALVRSGKIDDRDVEEWHRDYLNSGGGTIDPRRRTDT